MARVNNIFWVVLFLIVFVSFTTVYTVHEGQHGILLRLGKLALDPQTNKPFVYGPGVHFKLPFINTAQIFDTRMQTLDIKSSRIVTAEKKDVLVDYYAKWRIDDLPLYYTTTSGNEARAQTLLEQKLNDGLRAQFGKRGISEVVSGERSDIMQTLQQQANASAKSLGIKVIDVRIKRIDLPDEVSSAVYDRMRAERERVATEHRAEGKAKAEVIRASADAKVTVILATSRSESKKIRGEGDAQAAKIYADAYNRDADFFAFYRSLLAYQQSFAKHRDMLVLRPDSQFFRYFNDAEGKPVPKS